MRSPGPLSLILTLTSVLAIVFPAFAALFVSSSALADTIKIACQGETVTIPGWGSGTMNVTYDGGNQGTLAVKGPHTDFTVPAASHKYDSPLPPLVIDAAGDTKTIMPDLKAVDACATAKMPPKLEPDLYSVFAIPCLEKAPQSAAPVPIKATATLTFMRGADGATLDPMVQMKLTYLDKSASPDGTMAIELMPKECKIVP